MQPALMNLTASALSLLKAPTPPDFCECDAFYSRSAVSGERPTLVDCIDAFSRLPQGQDPVSWHTRPFNDRPVEERIYTFPLVRNSGTCQIKLSASGKYASENDLVIRIAPDELRQMALYTIEACVQKEDYGGYATKGFGKATEWITAPSTHFPGDPRLPPSITFFTALVWFSGREPWRNGYDPGEHDYWTTIAILEHLRAAKDAAPPRSALKFLLEDRYHYLYASAEIQDGGRERKWPWWGKYLTQGSSSTSIPVGNQTAACASNLVAPGAANCSSASRTSE